MTRGFVEKKYIDLVLDGFQQYYDQFTRTLLFNVNEMKKFMEPIFDRAGYRKSVHAGRCNVLLIHDAGVGDFVLMSPAIRELRRLYPTAHIALIVRQPSLNLAEHCPYVDEILTDDGSLSWKDFPTVYRHNQTLAAELLCRRYDIAFAFTHYPSTILLAYMSGARERVSHAFDKNNRAFEIGSLSAVSSLVTIKAPKWIYGAHGIDTNLALLSGVVRTPIDNREAEIWYTPLDYSVAVKLFREHLSTAGKIYALCMGGIGNRKKWSAENYARLATMIVEREPDVKFVILGGGKIDKTTAEIFKQHLDQRIVDENIFDAVNVVSYRVSAVLLSMCDMYIGNDTGTMHMAAAMKTPVLTPSCFAADVDVRFNVLELYHPYRVPSVTVVVKNALPECKAANNGIGCIVESRPHCIAQITVDKVFDGYNRLKMRIAEKNIEPLFIS